MTPASTPVADRSLTDIKGRNHAVLFDLEAGHMHRVSAEVVTIGSSNRCDITFQESNISNQHCLIARDAEGYRLYDLNSSSGCSINGIKVCENAQLYDGDEVTIGSRSFAFNLVDRHKEPTSEAKASRQFSWVRAFSGYLRGAGKH